MSNDTAPQVDISHGPVTLLAEVLRDLLRREQAIDRMEVAQEIDQEQIEAYRRCNLQAIEGIERVLACLAAAGPQEAVVQVLVAAGQLNSIDVTSDETSSVPERLETAVQLLRSALPVLAATTQVDLTHYRVERYGLAVAPSPSSRPIQESSRVMTRSRCSSAVRLAFNNGSTGRNASAGGPTITPGVLLVS